MKVTCWGCRGSIATPGPETVKYGGNTTCYAVESDCGELLILDAGSGIRELGLELMKAGPRRATILITHTHYDHIIGFPFFVPLYVPGFEWLVAGPPHYAREFGEVIDRSMSYEFFPVRRDELGAQVTFETWQPGVYRVGPFTVTTRLMNHPVTCLGYRVEVDGQSVTFTGDHEPFFDPIWAGREPASEDEEYERDELAAFAEKQNSAVRSFFAGSDLLIYDAMYTAAEYEQKRGWGHTSIEYAISDALEAEVGELWLSHHDPTRKDSELDALSRVVSEQTFDAPVHVEFAREGAVWSASDADRRGAGDSISNASEPGLSEHSSQHA